MSDARRPAPFPPAPRRRLQRRAPTPLALEQRFMFDGAAVTDAVHADAAADATPGTPLLLVKADAPPAVLAEAEKLVAQVVAQFAQQPAALQQLFAVFSGGQSTPSEAWQAQASSLLSHLRDGSYGVSLQVRSNDDLRGALAAFAAEGPDGKPVIFLNAQWLAMGPDAQALARVLAEEVGHSLDAALNPGHDTAGDEGDAFAELLLGRTEAGESRLADDDHALLAIDGTTVEVEEASVTFKAIFRGTPSAWSLQPSSITLGSQLNAVAGGIKFVSADPSALYFAGNNVAGNVVYTDSSGGVHTLSGVISRQFKTGSTTNAFFFYVTGNDGVVGGGDDSAYLLQVNADTTAYTFDGTANALYRTSSDPVDTALNSLRDASPPLLVAATSSSSGARVAIEAGGTSNTYGSQTGTGNVLDASLVTRGTGLSVIGVGTTEASESAVTAGTTSANGRAVTGLYGTLTLGANGTYSYVVNDSNATVQGLRSASDKLYDTFVYTAKDSSGNLATTTLTVTVQGQNDAPTASADYNTVRAGDVASGSVLSNDIDPDRNGESLSIVGLVASGTVSSYSLGGTQTTMVFNSVQGNSLNATSVGDAVYVNISGTYYLLKTSTGATITLASKSTNADGTYNFKLSGVVDHYLASTSYTITSSSVIDFKGGGGTPPDSTTSSSNMKEASVSSSSTTSSSTVTVATTSGTIAVGMTVSGTNIPSGAKVSAISGTSGALVVTLDTSLTAAPSGTLSFTAAGGVTISGTYGFLVLNPNGSYTYTANASSTNVSETFTYKMQDLAGSTSTSTLQLNVLGVTVSSSPDAVNDAASITEDASPANITGNVLSNDTTPSGTNTVVGARLAGQSSDSAVPAGTTSSSATALSLAGNYGTLLIGANGTYKYTLDNSNAAVNALVVGSTLTESFQYRIQNGASLQDVATLTVTINGSNDAPTLDLSPSNTAMVNFVTTFTQGDSAKPLVGPTGTHLADVDSGTFNKLTLSFTQANFADGASETLGITGATGTNTSIANLGGLANGASGSFTLGGVSYTYAVAVSGGVATLTFTPAAAMSQASAETLLTALTYTNTNTTNPVGGTARVITFTAYDATNVASNTATSTIALFNTVAAPTAVDDTASATESGLNASRQAIGTDPTGNVITGTGADTGSFLQVTQAQFGASITGSASAVASGSTSGSNATTVAGNYGSLVIGADGSYQYRVANGNATVQALQLGGTLTDTFSYQVTDQNGQVTTAKVTVTINGANDAPTVVTAPTNQVAVVDQPFTYVVPAFADVDGGDTITYRVSGLPGGASFNASTRAISWIPTVDQPAQTITVTGTDSKGATATATFTLEAASSPPSLTATDDTASATEAGGTNNGTEGTNPSGNLLANDTGSGLAVNWIWIVGAGGTYTSSPVTAGSTATSGYTSLTGAYGELRVGADGSFSYVVSNSQASVQELQAGTTRTDTFTYMVHDNQFSSPVSATITVTLNGANDAPTVTTAPTNQTATVGSAFSYQVAAFADVDSGDTITYSATGLPSGASFNASTRTITWTPGSVLSAQTVTITGNDGHGGSVSTSFTLGAVNPAAPVATADTASATEAGGTANGTAGTDPTGSVLGNDTGSTIRVTRLQASATLDSGAAGVQAGSTSSSNATAVLGTYGSLALGADGTYRYTVDNANADVQALQAGGGTLTDTFSYEITDQAGQARTATLTVTVQGANDAPTVTTAPTNQMATVGSLLTYQVPAFRDVDSGDSIRYSASGLPSGAIIDASTGVISWTPGSVVAAQTVTITGTDSQGASVTTTFTLGAANPAAPVATLDTTSATEAGGTANGTAGTDPTGSVLGNDTGSTIRVTQAQAGGTLDGSASSVASGSTSTSNARTLTGSYGTLSLGANGSYSYAVANANADVQALQVGDTLTDTFSYQITDQAGQTSTATLTVTVHGANDAPTVTTAPTNQTATVGSPFSYVVPAFADIDNADTITYSQSGLPSGASLDPATRTVTWTPGTVASAQTVTITGTDSQGGSVTATFTLGAVNPAAPVATLDNASATEAGGTANATAGTDPTGSVLGNDTGSTIRVTQAQAGGTLDGNASSVASGSTSTSNARTLIGSYGTLSLGADGSYSYAVANSNADVQALQVGDTLTDTFSYQITDQAGLTSTATLTVTVHGANDAPTAAHGSLGTARNQASSGTLPAATDPDDSGMTYAAGTGPAHGQVVVNANGSYTYTPARDYTGSDSFTYTVTDAQGASVTRTMSVTVGPRNTAPAGSDATGTTAHDTPLAGTLPVATDADDDALQYALGTGPAHGQVVVNANGSYSYTPAAGYAGTDSFTYTVSDGFGGSATYTVRLTVTPPPPAVVQAPAPAPAPTLAPPPVIEPAPVVLEQAVVLDLAPARTPAPVPAAANPVVVPAPAPDPAPTTVAAIATPAPAAQAMFLTAAAPEAVRITVVPAREASLAVFNGVPDQNFNASSQVRFQLPADAFSHTQEQAVVRIDAQRADGGPLPPWIRFDATTGRFEGQPPADAPAELAIKVTARDNGGREATTIFRIKLVTEKQGLGGRDSLSGQIAAAGNRSTPLERLLRVAQRDRMERMERMQRPQGEAPAERTGRLEGDLPVPAHQAT